MADTPIRQKLELDENLATEEQKRFLAQVRSLGRQPVGDEDAPAPKTLLEQRLDVIMVLMRAGEWHGHESSEVLGAQWGISEAAVRRLAAEASRVIRRQLSEQHEDRENLKIDMRAAFLRLARKAELIGSPNALKVAGDMLDRAGDYLGIKPALRVKQDRDPFNDYTDAELDAYIADGTRPARLART